MTHNFFHVCLFLFSTCFGAAMCPSSGELIVSIRLVAYVNLYRWPFGVLVWMSLIQTCTPNGHLYRVTYTRCRIDTTNPLKPELNLICYLLALLVHHFLHVSRIRVKSLTLRWLRSYIYIYGAPILDVSRSHTTTQHSR